MGKHNFYINYADGFEAELMQAKEEGRDIDAALEKEHAEILTLDGTLPEKHTRALAFMEKIQTLPYKADYPYVEPSEIDKIKENRPAQRPILDKSILSDEKKLSDRIRGAWFGRCSGCLLGKPVEGWHRERMHAMLRDTDNYPINYYMRGDLSDELIEKHKIWKGATWINNVSFMPEDDDTNYTIIGLKTVSQFTKDFTPEDIACIWLGNLPVTHTFTAERVAYRNLLMSKMPPESASYANPYREWIGAQIRADFFGYITPANPETGAELAFRDASVSHIKNGIYGEMWVAAMLSAAAAMNPEDKNVTEAIIMAGLSEVPEKCRLRRDLLDVVAMYKGKKSYDEVSDFIHTRYNEKTMHGWCHTNSNAMIVTAALLFGELNFERTVSMAVMAAFDTDCNGATAGSVLGMLLGADKLPAKWIDPLCDTIISGVDGFGKVKISWLADETMKYVIK